MKKLLILALCFSGTFLQASLLRTLAKKATQQLLLRQVRFFAQNTKQPISRDEMQKYCIQFVDRINLPWSSNEDYLKLRTVHDDNLLHSLVALPKKMGYAGKRMSESEIRKYKTALQTAAEKIDPEVKNNLEVSPSTLATIQQNLIACDIFRKIEKS